MTVQSVCFRIVEPMMFKGSAEFSPDVTGPQVMAQSNILPYPSTIAGALATLVLEDNPNLIPNPDVSRWAEEISQILGEGLKLRGPYLIRDKEVFVQANVESFIRVADLRCTFPERLLKPTFVSMFGIKMDDRKRTASEPTANRSMLYSTQMVAYDGSDVCIGIDIVSCSSRLEDAISKKKIIRLGGEGRLVAIAASDTHRLHSGEGNYLFIISPALFETTNDNVDRAINNVLLEIERNCGIKTNFHKASFGLIGG
ncbi:MAG: hypothetical protein QXP61_08500, partial [Nitrososphaerales archaeon]